MAIGAPRRDRAERSERGERGKHRHASSREDAGSRRRSSGGSYDRPRSRPQPVDEFFLKPYEPSPSAVKRQEEQAEPKRKSASKQPLAALLGGLGMPRRNS